MRTLLLLAVCACGGVKYSANTTKGVACSDLTEVWCDKVITECKIRPASELTNCRSGGQDGCCGNDRSCGNPVFSPTGAADCVNRIPSDSCLGFSDNGAPVLPAYCRQML